MLELEEEIHLDSLHTKIKLLTVRSDYNLARNDTMFLVLFLLLTRNRLTLYLIIDSNRQQFL